MAFCTSCGSPMENNATFCTKCGKGVTPQVAAAAGTAVAPAASTSAVAPGTQAVPQSSSGGALKIILIIVAVIVILGMIMAGLVGYGIYRARKSIHVSQHGDRAVIETPYGKVGGSTMSASEAAQELGVDLYPGAQQEGDAASGFMGNVSSVTLTLTTGDTVDKVAQFYKERYPKGFFTSEAGKFNLLAGDKRSTLTISAEEVEGQTKIVIAKITNKGKTDTSE